MEKSNYYVTPYNKSYEDELTIKLQDGEFIHMYEVYTDGKMGVPYEWGKNKFGKHTSENLVDIDESNSWYYTKFPDPNHKSSPDGQAKLFDDTLKAVEEFNTFIVKSSTGSGKTVLALNTIARLGAQALIIVPTDRLMSQWVERATEFLGLSEDDIGIVKQGVCDYKDKAITLASMKSVSLREYEEEFYTYHGLMFLDEAHKFGAEKMSAIMGMFYAKYQIPMSATPKRRDETKKILDNWYGDPKVQGENSDPVQLIVKPIEYHHQKQATNNELNNLIYNIGRNADRNDKLANILDDLYSKGRNILAISASTKQLAAIKKRIKHIPDDEIFIFADKMRTGNKYLTVPLKSRPDLVEYLKTVAEDLAQELNDRLLLKHEERIIIKVSKVSMTIRSTALKFGGVIKSTIIDEVYRLVKDNSILIKTNDEFLKTSKEEIDSKLNDENIRLYLATYGVMEMGIDVPHINTGIDLTPRAKALQTAGRIVRIHGDKKQAYWFTPIDVGYSPVIDNINNSRLRDYAKRSNTIVES